MGWGGGEEGELQLEPFPKHKTRKYANTASKSCHLTNASHLAQHISRRQTFQIYQTENQKLQGLGGQLQVSNIPRKALTLRKLHRFVVGINQDKGCLPVDGDLVEEQHLRQTGCVDGTAGGCRGYRRLAAGLALQHSSWLL